MTANPPAQFNLSPMRHAAVDIHILANKRRRNRFKLDLIVELIVEVNRRERIPAFEKALLETRFERVVLFRLQVRIRIRRKSSCDSELLLKCRLLDAASIREAQPRSRKPIPPAQR